MFTTRHLSGRSRTRWDRPTTGYLCCERLEDRRLLAVVTVDTNLDVVDFTDGLTSLREAIFATNLLTGADEIQFDFGHSDPETIVLAMSELVVTDSLTITGHGAHLLTIDANQQSRLINVEGTSVDVTLSGFKLTNGRRTVDNQSPFESTHNGGGIRFLSNGALTLDDIALTGNSTEGDYASGGGIYASRGTVTLIGSTVNGNSTAGHGAAGGGIYSFSAVTLTDSDLSNNRTMGNVAEGGGVYSRRDIILTHSVVSENSTLGSSARGGGIFTLRGNVTLTRSSVSGNSTAGIGADGGGIVSANPVPGLVGAVTLDHSTVSGNSTAGDHAQGGGIDSVTPVTVIGSTVSRNSTAGLSAPGGGIFSRNGVTLVGSTLSENSTQGENSDGGGIRIAGHSSDVSLTISSSIVAGNTVASGSQGPDFVPDPDGLLDLDSSLIGDNLGTTLIEAQTPDANGNLIGGSIGGVINPLLGPLAANGGPTKTHALLPGSPAIDTGDNPLGLLFDQRGVGFDRVVGAMADIGSFEVQPAPLDGDFDHDGDLDGDDIDLLVANIAIGPQDPATFDLTNDGLVNLDDRDQWLALAGALNLPSGNPYLLGDANLDGAVDGQDFLIWNDHKFTATPAWTAGDFDANGVVNGQDFVIWNGNRFQTADQVGAATTPGSTELADEDDDGKEFVFGDRVFALLE